MRPPVCRLAKPSSGCTSFGRFGAPASATLRIAHLLQYGSELNGVINHDVVTTSEIVCPPAVLLGFVAVPIESTAFETRGPNICLVSDGFARACQTDRVEIYADRLGSQLGLDPRAIALVHLEPLRSVISGRCGHAPLAQRQFDLIAMMGGRAGNLAVVGNMCVDEDEGRDARPELLDGARDRPAAKRVTNEDSVLQLRQPKHLHDVRDMRGERDVVAHEVRSLGEACESWREDAVAIAAQECCYSLPAPPAVPCAVYEHEIPRSSHDLSSTTEHGVCPCVVRSSQSAHVMKDAGLQERWDGAIAQLTEAMRHLGPRPADPAFALEFASLARAAKRQRSNVSQVLLHGSPEAVTTLRKQLNLPQLAGDDEIVDVVILPAVRKEAGLAHEPEGMTQLRESVELLERSLQERPQAIYLVNDDVERVAAVMQKVVAAAHAEIGYATTFTGEPLYAVTKQYAHDRDIIDAIGVVYVFSTDGRLLLQQRAEDKTWDHSAAGHLAIGEEPIDGAARELREELHGAGDLRAVGTGIAHHPPGFPPRRHFFHCYTLTSDGPFELDPLEVLAVHWTTPKELEGGLARDQHNYAGGLHATYAWLKQHIGWNTR